MSCISSHDVNKIKPLATRIFDSCDTSNYVSSCSHNQFVFRHQITEQTCLDPRALTLLDQIPEKLIFISLIYDRNTFFWSITFITDATACLLISGLDASVIYKVQF